MIQGCGRSPRSCMRSTFATDATAGPRSQGSMRCCEDGRGSQTASGRHTASRSSRGSTPPSRKRSRRHRVRNNAEPELDTELTLDGLTIMAARGLRMLASGYLAVILGLYLSALGYSDAEIGLLFTVALAGGAATTIGTSLYADRWGRRTLLI